MDFAENFPDRQFDGVDIDQRSVNEVQQRITQSQLKNVHVKCMDAKKSMSVSGLTSPQYDLIYAGDGVASTMTWKDWTAIIKRATGPGVHYLKLGGYIVFSVVNRASDISLQGLAKTYQSILANAKERKKYSNREEYGDFLNPSRVDQTLELATQRRKTAAMGCEVEPHRGGYDSIDQLIASCEYDNNCVLEIVEKRPYKKDELRVNIPSIKSKDCYWVVMRYWPYESN